MIIFDPLRGELVWSQGRRAGATTTTLLQYEVMTNGTLPDPEIVFDGSTGDVMYGVSRTNEAGDPILVIAPPEDA